MFLSLALPSTQEHSSAGIGRIPILAKCHWNWPMAELSRSGGQNKYEKAKMLGLFPGSRRMNNCVKTSTSSPLPTLPSGTCYADTEVSSAYSACCEIDFKGGICELDMLFFFSLSLQKDEDNLPFTFTIPFPLFSMNHLIILSYT